MLAVREASHGDAALGSRSLVWMFAAASAWFNWVHAPRGIDSRITGNAATHVYGRVVVPPHVGAVNDMVRARGDEPPPISQLTAGRFYVSLEGHQLTETTVPMCLSHHGPPLEESEISERARSKRQQP